MEKGLPKDASRQDDDAAAYLLRAATRLADISARIKIPTFSSLLVAIAISAIAALRFMVTPGNPSYQHDWNWPGGQEEVLAQLHDSLSAWSFFGLGQRPIYPFGAYEFVVLMSLAAITSSKFALCAYMVGCGAIAGFGAGRLAVAAGARTHASIIVATALYGVSPVLFDKIAAGHIYYWLSYALLPWIALICSAAIKQSALQRFCALGLLVSLSAAQAQFLIFDTVIVLAMALVAEWRRRVALIGALCVPLVVHAYSFVTLLRPPVHAAPLDAQRATFGGVLSQSVTIPQLASQIGYPPAYYERLVIENRSWPLVEGSWQLIFVLALVGFVASCIIPRFQRKLIAPLFALGLFGAIIVSGLNAPFGPILGAIFAAFPEASILKELYHAMALVALFVAVMYAIAIDILLELARHDVAFKRIAVIGTLLVAYLCLPYMSGLVADAMPFTDDGPLSRATNGLRGGPSRVLLEPLVAPIKAVRSMTGGGVDYQTARPYEHAALNSVLPGGQDFWIDAQLRRRHRSIIPLLRAYGVDTVFARRGLVSSEGGLRNPGLPAAGLRNVTESISGDVESYSSIEPESLLRASSSVILTSDDRDRSFGAVEGKREPFRIRIFASDAADVVDGAIERDADVSPPEYIGRYVPVESYLPMSPARSDFDPRNGWASIETAGRRNDWVSRSVIDPIFTVSQVPLNLNAIHTSSAPQELLLWAAFGESASSRMVLSDTSASISAPVVSLDPLSGRTGFHWYRFGAPVSGARALAISFPRANAGVAIARVALMPAARLASIFGHARAIKLATNTRKAPQLEIRSADPESYDVALHGDSGNCGLELLTAFDEQWHAIVPNGVVARHFRADGWANGWFVPCNLETVAIHFDGRFYHVTLVIGFLLQGALAACWLWQCRAARTT